MHALAATCALTDAVGAQHYVMQLESLPGGGTLMASVSTGGMKLVHLAEGGQVVQGQVAEGFVEPVTDLHARASLGDPHLFQCSSTDGFVRTWDTRAGGHPVESYSSQHGRPVYSCDGDGTRVLGGVGDEIYLWDRRTRKTIKQFPDTHFMDVVQVRWSGPDAFISASEDGNIAVFDLSQVICEEDSFVGAVSINSMRRMGLFGQDNERLWCASNTETLHWWDWRAACDEAPGAGTGAAEAPNAREDTNAHYLIRCHQDRAGMVVCMSGTVDGQMMMYECHDQGGVIHFGSAPLSVLTGGHQGVVRDALVLPDGTVASAAEDGRICLWTACTDLATVSLGKNSRYSPY
jgi:WD40 repeat protein